MRHFFQRLGLTKKEEDIYLFLLEYGHAIASLIGKRLGINRVTVYALLRSLQEKNLVTSFKQNNVTYFEAASPEDMLALCQQKVSEQKGLEEEAKALLPQLTDIQNKKQKPLLEVKGVVKYYQGLEAVKSLINETLQEGRQEQLCFGLNRYHTQHLKDEWKAYTEKRVEVGMGVRSIQPDTIAAKAYKERDKDELRITRLVPHEQFPAESELNIIGDMIALFTAHGDKPAGMKVYHKDMATVLRSLFELAWERAREYDKE